MYKFMVSIMTFMVLVNSSPLYMIDTTYAAGSADLKVVTNGPATGTNKENFEYEVVIQNGGLDAADGATFSNTFPAWSTNIVATCTSTLNGATCPASFSTTSTQVNGTIPTFPYNGSVTIKISGRYAIVPNSSVSNTVSVSVPAGMTEIDPSTNSAQTNTVMTIRPADLETTVVASGAGTGNWNFWDLMTYTITYTNKWPGPIDGAYIQDYRYFNYASGYVQGNLSYSDYTITCTATWWVACPTDITPTPTWTMTLQNYIYPYSLNVPWEWPSSGALTLTMTIRPTSFANTTACGPNRGSALYFYTSTYWRVPNWINDPVYNQDKSLVSWYGPYQQVDPCPNVDLQTTITQNASSWDIGDTVTFNINYKNNGTWSVSGAAISLNELNLRYMSWQVQWNLSYENLSISCTSTWWVACPTITQPSANGVRWIYSNFWTFYATVGEWPQSGELNYTVSFKVTNFQNTTTCGPNYGSRLYLFAYSYTRVPIGLTDPVYNHDSYSYLYNGPYQQVDPCPVADVQATVNVSTGNWTYGQPITYTYTYTNNWPANASWTTIQGGLYSNSYSYYFTDRTISCTSTWWVACPSPYNSVMQWNTSINSFSQQVGNWPAGASFTITETFTPLLPTTPWSSICANPDTTSVNVNPYFYLNAYVPSGTTDPVYNSNQYLYSNYIFTCADLTIAKTVTPETIMPSSAMSFQLQVGNAAGGTVSNSVLEDILPAGFLYASGSCASSGGWVCGLITYNTWSRLFSSIIPTLPRNGSLIYTLYGTSYGQSSIWTNIATITWSSAQLLEKSPSTNRAQVNFSIIGTDPLVRKVSLVKNLTPWDTIPYQISIVNPSSWELIEHSTISDLLPVWFTYDSTTSISLGAGATRISTQNPTAWATQPVWWSFELQPWATVQINFLARVPAQPACIWWVYHNSARYDYYAQISQTGSKLFDGDLIGNYTDDIYCIPAVSYTKTVDKTNITWWDSLSWTISVMNTGALATTWSMIVTDYLNSSLTGVVTSVSSGVVCSSSTNPLTCTIPSGLAPYTGQAQITISAITSEYATTYIQNTATVQYAGATVPCASSSCAPSTTIIPKRAEIYQTKTVDKSTITGADTLTYTYTLWNSGLATNVFPITLTDYLPRTSYSSLSGKYEVTNLILPAGITCPSVSAWNEDTVACTIAPWALPAWWSLEMKMELQMANDLPNNINFSNRSYIYSPNSQTSIMSSWAYAYTYVQLPSARLYYNKTVNTGQIAPWWEATYTITVGNSWEVTNVTWYINEYILMYGHRNGYADYQQITAVSTPTGITCPDTADWTGNTMITCTIAPWAILPWESISMNITVKTSENIGERWIYNDMYMNSDGDIIQWWNGFTNFFVKAPAARIRTMKTVDKLVASPGDDLLYTLSFSNSGEIANQWTITINEYLLNFISWYGAYTDLEVTSVNTPTGITCPALVDWTGTDTIQCQIDAWVISPWETVSMTIGIKAPLSTNDWVYNQFGTNFNDSRDQSYGGNTYVQTYLWDQAVINADKVVDKTTLYSGELLNYTLSISNVGKNANQWMIYLSDYFYASYALSSLVSWSGSSVLNCPDIENGILNWYINCTINPWELLSGETVMLNLTLDMDENQMSSWYNIGNEMSVWLSNDIGMNNYKYVQTTYNAETLLPPMRLIEAHSDTITLDHSVSWSLSIFDNDVLSGTIWVDTTNVMIIMTGGLEAGITFDPITGIFSIDTSVQPGTYVYDYMICEMIHPTNCSSSTASITINPIPVLPVISAQADALILNQGQSWELSLFTNDTYNGSWVLPSDVTISLSWVLASGIVLDSVTGILSISNTVLSGSYYYDYTICSVVNTTNCSTSTITIVIKPQSTSWWWGWWYTLPTDSCPNGDKSWSAYDGICEKKPSNPWTWSTVTWDSTTGWVDEEIFNPTIGNTCFTIMDKNTIDQWILVTEAFKKAHQMLYSYELTRWQGTADYRPYDGLTRQEAARFMVEFAVNVLCRKPNKVYNNNFNDIADANPTLISYIKKSYEYNIFQWDQRDGESKISTTFRPFDIISKDEIIAIMVRLVTNEYNEQVWTNWADYYRDFLAQRVNTQLQSIIRNDIAVTIYDLYRNNDYHMEEIGYVINK